MARQGAHQVAQKSTIRSLFSAMCRLRDVPSAWTTCSESMILSSSGECVLCADFSTRVDHTLRVGALLAAVELHGDIELVAPVKNAASEHQRILALRHQMSRSRGSQSVSALPVYPRS